jgi:hypothetical protein
MRKLFIILLLNYFVVSFAAGGDSNNAMGRGRLPNEPNMLQRLEAVRQKLAARNQQPVEINQPAAAQIADENQKHNQRIAALNHILQLAEQEKFIDIIERADRLIKMENDRHLKKLARLQPGSASAAEVNEPNK